MKFNVYLKRPVVGLYINPNFIEIAVIAQSIVNKIEIKKILNRRISIYNVNIQDQDSIISAVLKEFFSEIDVPNRNIFLNLSSKDVVFRTFSMQRIPKESWSKAIMFEAQKYIPFSEDNIFLDYIVLNENDATEEIYVCVICAKKDIISRYLNIFEEIDVTCQNINSCFFSMARFALYKNLVNINKPTLIMNVQRNMIGKNSLLVYADMCLFFKNSVLMARNIFIVSDEETVDAKFFNEVFLSVKLFNSFLQEKIKEVVFFEGFSLYRWERYFLDNFSLKVLEAKPKGVEKIEQAISIGAALTSFYTKKIDINLLNSKVLNNANIRKFSDSEVINFFIKTAIIFCLIIYIFCFLKQKIIERKEKKLLSSISQMTQFNNQSLKEFKNKNKNFYKEKRFQEKIKKKKFSLYKCLSYLNIFFAKEEFSWMREISFQEDFRKKKRKLIISAMITTENSVNNLIFINNFKSELINNSIIQKFMPIVGETSIHKKIIPLENRFPEEFTVTLSDDGKS